MNVFLCRSGAGLYYAGGKDWVRERQQAVDLETIERAVELAREGDLDSMVIVVSTGHPSSDWFLPIRPRLAPRSKTVVASVHPPLSRAA